MPKYKNTRKSSIQDATDIMNNMPYLPTEVWELIALKTPLSTPVYNQKYWDFFHIIFPHLTTKRLWKTSPICICSNELTKYCGVKQCTATEHISIPLNDYDQKKYKATQQWEPNPLHHKCNLNCTCELMIDPYWTRVIRMFCAELTNHNCICGYVDSRRIFVDTSKCLANIHRCVCRKIPNNTKTSCRSLKHECICILSKPSSDIGKFNPLCKYDGTYKIPPLFGNIYQNKHMLRATLSHVVEKCICKHIWETKIKPIIQYLPKNALTFNVQEPEKYRYNKCVNRVCIYLCK